MGIGPEVEPYAYSYLDDIITLTKFDRYWRYWRKYYLAKGRMILQLIVQKVNFAKQRFNTSASTSIETEFDLTLERTNQL